MSILIPLLFTSLLVVCGAANAQVMGGGGGGANWILYYQSGPPFPLTANTRTDEQGPFYNNTGSTQTINCDLNQTVYSGVAGDAIANPPTWPDFLASVYTNYVNQTYNPAPLIIPTGYSGYATLDWIENTGAETWLNTGSGPTQAERQGDTMTPNGWSITEYFGD